MIEGLEFLVNHYKEKVLSEAIDHHEFYKNLDDIELVIQYAAEARTHHQGGKHPHQHRLNNDMLHFMGTRLARKIGEFRNAGNFDEIFQLVSSNRIRGFGELAIYDTAFRIGLFLRKCPEYVYLHAGTRIGAEYLTIVRRKDKISMNDLPSELSSLKPWQAEDFLCIYKDGIEELLKNQEVDLDQLGDSCLRKRRRNIIC